MYFADDLIVIRGLLGMPDLAGERAHLCLHALGQPYVRDPRRRQQRCELTREDGVRVGVVAGQSVECRLPDPSRKQDEHALRRVHARQTTGAADTPHADVLERIVSTGVEHENHMLGPSALDAAEHVIDGESFVTNEAILIAPRLRQVGGE